MSEPTIKEGIAHGDWLRVRRDSQEKERAMRALVERKWWAPGGNPNCNFALGISIDYDNRVRVHVEGQWGTSKSTAIINGDICNLPTQVLLAYAELRRVVDEWVAGTRASLPGSDWNPFGIVKNLTEADRG